MRLANRDGYTRRPSDNWACFINVRRFSIARVRSAPRALTRELPMSALRLAVPARYWGLLPRPAQAHALRRVRRIIEDSERAGYEALGRRLESHRDLATPPRLNRRAAGVGLREARAGHNAPHDQRRAAPVGDRHRPRRARGSDRALSKSKSRGRDCDASDRRGSGTRGRHASSGRGRRRGPRRDRRRRAGCGGRRDRS